MSCVPGITGAGALVSALSAAAGGIPADSVDLIGQAASVSVLKKALDVMRSTEEQLLQMMPVYSFSPGRGLQVNAIPSRHAIDVTA